jgi:hypothetical protein
MAPRRGSPRPEVAALFVVRDAQLAALSDAAFDRWLADHLAGCFPGRCRAAGERGVAAAIRNGRAAAAEHGITEAEDLRRYLCVTFALGEGSERFTWIREILADVKLGPPRVRIHLLEQAALAYLEQRADGAHV